MTAYLAASIMFTIFLTQVNRGYIDCKTAHPIIVVECWGPEGCDEPDLPEGCNGSYGYPEEL